MFGGPLGIPRVGICIVTNSRASPKGSDIIRRWAKVQFCFSQHKISWGHVDDIPLSGLAQPPASAPRSPKISAISNGGPTVPQSPSVVPRSPRISSSNNGGPMVPKTPSPLPPARAGDQAEATCRKPSNISLRSNVSTCVATCHTIATCHVSRVPSNVSRQSSLVSDPGQLYVWEVWPVAGSQVRLSKEVAGVTHSQLSWNQL